jgi:hypothetical protein
LQALFIAVRVLPITITIMTRMASIGLFIGTSLLRAETYRLPDARK